MTGPISEADETFIGVSSILQMQKARQRRACLIAIVTDDPHT